MSNKVKIAIDAMGGENSPKKIIEGIEISLKSNQENFFYLYGQKDLLEKEIAKKRFTSKHCEIINTKDIILDDESPLGAAKKACLINLGQRALKGLSGSCVWGQVVSAHRQPLVKE